LSSKIRELSFSLNIFMVQRSILLESVSVITVIIIISVIKVIISVIAMVYIVWARVN